jgi:hypothetical protein
MIGSLGSIFTSRLWWRVRTSGWCAIMGAVIGDLVRPRWGIGSVRLHLDVQDLTLAVLLFDRLVLPTPENEEDVERWVNKGWQPGDLAKRVVQLGELVDLLPWDGTLRADWQARWQQLQVMGSETEALAYGMTPMVIAKRAWDDVYLSALRERRAPVKPEPVVWCPAGVDAMRELDIEIEPSQTSGRAGLDHEVGVLFRRELEHPIAADPEEALEIAIKLAATDDFVAARRALFQWELIIAGQEEPLDSALEGLRNAADRYDALVKEHADGTMRRMVHVLVPAAAAHAANLSAVPGSGFAAGWSARRVVARFVPLPPPPDPASQEGAALSAARRAMSAVFAG